MEDKTYNVYGILKEHGCPVDISDRCTYVTVEGIEKAPKLLKVLKVRCNTNHGDIEFLSEGIDFWISDSACIMNTATRIYNVVLSKLSIS